MGEHEHACPRVLRVLSRLSGREMHTRRWLGLQATCFEYRHVGIAGKLYERRALSRVARIHDSMSARFDAQPIGLDGVIDTGRRHVEGTDAVLACDEVAKVELPRHAWLLCEVVGPGHALSRALRTPDRDGIARPLRVVALRHVEPAQVEAVIGMQVGEDDGVDVRQCHMALQHSQGPIAEVEHESEPVVLDQVAGRRRVRPGE